MLFSIGWRIAASALWIAVVTAPLYFLPWKIVDWLSAKAKGNNPGKVRYTFSKTVVASGLVLIFLTGRRSPMPFLFLAIWWHFIPR